MNKILCISIFSIHLICCNNGYTTSNCNQLYDISDKSNHNKFYYTNENKIINWDLELNGNNIHIDNENKKWKYMIVILTNNYKEKFKKLIVKGDNRWVNGIIITTPEIDEVEFGQWSFVRTINISGKKLKYIFKGNNLFTPFIDYNKIIADRPDDITIQSNKTEYRRKNKNNFDKRGKSHDCRNYSIHKYSEYRKHDKSCECKQHNKNDTMPVIEVNKRDNNDKCYLNSLQIETNIRVRFNNIPLILGDE